MPAHAHSQDEIQEKVVLYQILTRQLEEMKSQAMFIERKLMEFDISRKAVSDMKKIKDGAEILMPVGSGVYLHGTVSPSKKVLVDIGANLIVSKEIADAEGVLNFRKAEIEMINEKLLREVTDVVGKINNIAMEIEHLQGNGAHT